MDVREKLIERVKQTIQGVASIYGVVAEVEFENNSPTLENDPEALKTMFAAAADVVGADHVLRRPVPMGFGGDDFAAFSQKIPGCFIHVGSALEGEADTMLPLHSPDINIPDETVAVGTEILIRCALAHLE